LFAQQKIWAIRAKHRCRCDAIIAPLDRFLLTRTKTLASLHCPHGAAIAHCSAKPSSTCNSLLHLEFLGVSASKNLLS
jgi:hypothetical protein